MAKMIDLFKHMVGVTNWFTFEQIILTEMMYSRCMFLMGSEFCRPLYNLSQCQCRLLIISVALQLVMLYCNFICIRFRLSSLVHHNVAASALTTSVSNINRRVQAEYFHFSNKISIIFLGLFYLETFVTISIPETFVANNIPEGNDFCWIASFFNGLSMFFILWFKILSLK